MASNVSRRKRRLWALMAQAVDTVDGLDDDVTNEQRGKTLEDALRDLGFEMRLRPGSTADEVNRVD